METAKYEYLGNAITFQRDNGSVMVNATDMAKPFSKQPSDWFRQKSTLEYLEALKLARGNPRTADYVIITSSGTWVNEDITLEFARWLSPAFAIWCNDRMKELLKYGATAINPDDLLNPDFIIKLATELKVERARTALLEAQNGLKQEMLQLQDTVIKESAPKVQYFDTVMQSDTLITTNVIAKDHGMTAIALNKILHEEKIIYKSGETWVLYQPYQNKGFTGTKTYSYRDSNGNERTSIQTYWTELGREFLHKVIQKHLGNG